MRNRGLDSGDRLGQEGRQAQQQHIQNPNPFSGANLPAWINSQLHQRYHWCRSKLTYYNNSWGLQQPKIPHRMQYSLCWCCYNPETWHATNCHFSSWQTSSVINSCAMLCETQHKLVFWHILLLPDLTTAGWAYILSACYVTSSLFRVQLFPSFLKKCRMFQIQPRFKILFSPYLEVVSPSYSSRHVPREPIK